MPRRSQTTHIVVHTAAWPGDPSVAEIDRAHRARGFARVGYHYVIRKGGAVEVGRNEMAVGAHCADGGMNHRSVGVCFSGHHNLEPWTHEQRAAWLDLAARLVRRFAVPVENVIGHREAGARKDCPGTQVDMGSVRRELASHLHLEAARDGAPAVGRGLLRRGSRGPLVAVLQRALRTLRHYHGAVDGEYGPRTERAVRVLQSLAGLSVDGVAGPATWGALDRMGL